MKMFLDQFGDVLFGFLLGLSLHLAFRALLRVILLEQDFKKHLAVEHPKKADG